MSGIAEIWSKAVALALLELAREQKRDFYCIQFSSGYSVEDLHVNEFKKDDPYDIKEVIDLAEHFSGGGTEFQLPLDLAREKIGLDQRYSKSDIIFITDGCAVVTDSWLTEFLNWKKDNKVKIYGVLIDSGYNTSSSLKEFCDEIQILSDIKSNTERELIATTIFEII